MENSTNTTESPVAGTEEEQVPIANTEEEVPTPPVTESPKAEAQAVNENPEEDQAPLSVPTEENSSSPKPSSHKEEEISAIVAEDTLFELNREEVEVAAADPVSVPVDVPETTAPSAAQEVNGNSNNITEANGESENKETTGNVTVVVAEKPQGKKEEESMPPEADSVLIPPHWHAKPCLHITSIGGLLTEEQHRCKQSWMEGCCL